MTLAELLYVLVLIAIVNFGMVIARLWSVEVGTIIGAIPFAWCGLIGVVGAVQDRVAARNRIPRARALTRRAS